MCGLVGMAGDLSLKHRNAFKDLLFLNTLRGQDSTGVASIRRNRDVDLRKSTVPGHEFIQNAWFDRLCGVSDQLWIGHGRYKTVGNATRNNAHPFQVLDKDGFISTIGVHNGTLTNKYEIEKALDGETFGTDSEALINLIDKVGPKKAIGTAEGAWSLVWWTAVDNTVSFIRNDQRPLVYAFSKDRRSVIWASEAWMILAACNRNDVELDKNDKGLSCFATTENTLYTLEIPQVAAPLDAFIKKGGLLGAPQKPHFSRQSYGHWWNEFDDPDYETPVEAAARKLAEANSPGTQNVIIGLPPANHDMKYVGYKGKQLTIAEMLAIKEAGCVWCGERIFNSHMAFVDDDSPICGRCLTGSHPKFVQEVKSNVQSILTIPAIVKKGK